MKVDLRLLKDFDIEETFLIEWLINEFLLTTAKDYYLSVDFKMDNEIMLPTENVINHSPFDNTKTETIISRLENKKHISRTMNLIEFYICFESKMLKEHLKNRLKEAGIE